jgi:neutral ceramidase
MEAHMKSTALSLLVLIPLAACGSNEASPPVQDAAGDSLEVLADLAPTDGFLPDTEPRDGEPLELPPYYGELVAQDDLFRVGAASGELFAPVGIPTAGYGESTGGDDPRSPFAKAFAATTTMHQPPRARALYLTRQQQELLVIRIDKIGTTPELLDEFTRRLGKKTGRAWDGKVILASNHTHLGPGRLWENFVGEFANDQFWPQYYFLFIDSIVEVALASLLDAEPGRFGYGKTQCPECHNDRRCESPENLDSTLWVFRFDTAAGDLKAILLDFAIHGTVFGWRDYTLTGDAPGAMEEKLQETFDHPVEVLMVQSWGGDVAPDDPPTVPVQPVNPLILPDYDRLERIGFAAAGHVTQLLPAIEMTDDVQLSSITLRPPIDYPLLGYEPGEWDYPDGGMMCGTNSPAHCWGEEGPDPAMGCFPMSAGMAPYQFVLSAFRINDALFFTLPGEPTVELSLEAVELLRGISGLEDVILVGFAQDHWGYLLKEYDWWLGGYEPTVNFWGPKQGEYMVSQLPHVVSKLLDPAYVLPFEPNDPLKTPPGGAEIYKPMESTGEPAVLTQPAPEVEATAAAVLVFAGGDPWFGTPVVSVEIKDGEDWVPVVRKNGTPFGNRTLMMDTRLEMLPTWKEDKKTWQRQFRWTVTLPAKRNVPCEDTLQTGSYRFRIAGSFLAGDAVQPFDIVSEPFAIN